MEQEKQSGISAQRLALAKRQFIAEGVSIRRWALARGYNPRTVYAVLQGKLECRYGLSHKIAVDLGLKATGDDNVQFGAAA